MPIDVAGRTGPPAAVTPGALAGGAIWFVLGMVLFLTLAGSLGSLAERQEEAGVVVAPLTFLLVGTFIAAQSAADTTFGIVFDPTVFLMVHLYH